MAEAGCRLRHEIHNSLDAIDRSAPHLHTSWPEPSTSTRRTAGAHTGGEWPL